MVLGSTSLFTINNVVTTPPYNGSFLIDVTAYDTDGTTVIESWSVYLFVTPPEFPSASVSSLCLGRGKTTILSFTFLTQQEVPAGITQTSATDKKGFIELEFTNHVPDLGYTGATAPYEIACRPSAGLSPSNENIICY